MTSRESILRAATSVFAAKGRYGSRMELIADEADINKAMIYYIYVSKDELYREVVVRMISELTREIVGYSELMAERGAPPAETVPSIVDFLFFLFSNNAEYTGILMDAIVNGREEINAAVAECDRVYGDRIRNSGIGCLFNKYPEKRANDRADFICIVGMVFSCFVVGNKALGEKNRNLYDRMKTSVVDIILHGALSFHCERSAEYAGAGAAGK